MHDTKLVKQTCTQHCDHEILRVWPLWTKIKTSIWAHSVKAGESSFK